MLTTKMDGLHSSMRQQSVKLKNKNKNKYIFSTAFVNVKSVIVFNMLVNFQDMKM